MLEVRDEIAHRRRAQTDERRVLGHVDDLVDLPWLEASFEPDAPAILDDLAVFHPAEAPFLARDGLPLRLDAVSHGQHVLGCVEVGDFIRNVVAVRERMGVLAVRHDEVRPREPPDRLASRTLRRRRVDEHLAGIPRWIELPADPQQRVALFEQQAVAEILLVFRVETAGGAVEHAQHALPAAVVDLEQYGPVAAGQIHRLDQVDIR